MAASLKIDALVQKIIPGSTARETVVESESPYIVSAPAVVGDPLKQITIDPLSTISLSIGLIPDVRAIIIKVITPGAAVTLYLVAGGTPIEVSPLYIQTFPSGSASNPSVVLIENAAATVVRVEVWMLGDTV